MNSFHIWIRLCLLGCTGNIILFFEAGDLCTGVVETDCHSTVLGGSGESGRRFNEITKCRRVGGPFKLFCDVSLYETLIVMTYTSFEIPHAQNTSSFLWKLWTPAQYDLCLALMGYNWKLIHFQLSLILNWNSNNRK